MGSGGFDVVDAGLTSTRNADAADGAAVVIASQGNHAQRAPSRRAVKLVAHGRVKMWWGWERERQNLPLL